MPRLTINTTEAMSFAPAQPGQYLMKVVEIGAPEEGDKCTYVPVKFAFDDPDIARKCGQVFRNYPITGKGAGFFREFWKATTGEDIPMDAEIDVDTDDALGRMVVAQVENREWDGNIQNEIKKLVAA